MTVPTNLLQRVETYQKEVSAYMLNSSPLASLADGKFENFQEKEANLGDSISWDLAPHSIVSRGLVANFMSSKQRKMTLVCDQAANAGRAFTAQQVLFFEVEQYMKKFGKADTLEFATEVESSLGLSINGTVPVLEVKDDGQSYPTGAYHTQSGAYRFYDATATGITTFQQLQQINTNYRNFGSVKESLNMVLPDTIVPPIIGTQLNQFSPKRNDEMINSWQIGEFGSPPTMYHTSNVLPLHTAGTLGNDAVELTVVSTNDPTGQNITTITCSGAGTDSDAVRVGDFAQFQDGVSGQPNMRFLTPVGHKQTAQPVQMRMSASAASSAGSVTLTLAVPLVSAPGTEQNLNHPIAAGMKIKLVKNFRMGVLFSPRSFYLAMPRLPDEQPYPTARESDEETGISVRMYYGVIPFKNTRGIVIDGIWGSCFEPDYAMAILLPENT